MQVLTPIHAKERIVFMDVLRGFAILGIFLANLGSGFSWYRESAHFTGPLLLPYLDHKLQFLYAMFLDGKFYSIFSLLFGWGIALQVKKGIEKGIDAVPTIRRRLFFMLLLGAFHLLLWPGDIVFFYALLGFLLLPLRRLSNKTSLITGGVFILLPIAFYAAKMHWPVFNAPAKILFDIGAHLDQRLNGNNSEQDFIKMLHEGSWWDILKADIAGFFFRYGDLFFISRIWKVLGMFLVGYVVGRSDFYQLVKSNPKILYPFIVLGLVIGLPANYFLAYCMTHYEGEYYQLTVKGLYQTVAYALGVAPLAIAYTGMMAIAFQSAVGSRVLSLLAPVGKMAFSNYILQSLIGNFVFLGAGLGYMGQVGPVFYSIFGVLVFILQIIFSTIWFQYFNFGPLEWLWRSATYKQWQPLKKRVAVLNS